jgi:hypothetical protein
MQESQESSKFKIHYRKTKAIDLEEWVNKTIDASQNSPYKIAKLQQYNPVYSQFFELNETNYDSISLNNKYQIHSIDKVVNTVSKEIEEKAVFTKFSPLIDPIRYMIGKAGGKAGGKSGSKTEPTEPTDSNLLKDFELPKLNDSHAIPTTDAFFSFLTSTLLNHHDFKNGLDYYGSFLGIQERFKVNIEDDLEYLTDSDYFMDNIGKLMTLENYESRSEHANFGSRGNKTKIQVLDELANLNTIDLEISELDNSLQIDSIQEVILGESAELVEPELVDTLDLVEADTLDQKQPKNTSSSSHSSASSENTSNNSELNYSTDEDGEDKDMDKDEDHQDRDEDEDHQDQDEEEWTTESSCSSSSSYSSGQEVSAYIHNFPVQMICLEKCDGTFDDLFVNQKIDPKTGASALFQIIMSLILYQKAFHFTHNDLHTNNVMYINTDQEYLYYTYNSIHYRVPTYGRIFKIIDFGRAIYKYQGKLFCSESFAQGGDASTQYNCEPYFNKNKPRLEPNYSFDLCRLGCSIFDFIIEDDEPYNSLDDLQKTIYRWCLDDSKKNILYKKNGEERYPDFKLYKMIARTVHHHTPQEQLEYPFFKQFKVDSDQTVDQSEYMNIDMIPQYV